MGKRSEIIGGLVSGAGLSVITPRLAQMMAGKTSESADLPYIFACTAATVFVAGGVLFSDKINVKAAFAGFLGGIFMLAAAMPPTATPLSPDQFGQIEANVAARRQLLEAASVVLK